MNKLASGVLALGRRTVSAKQSAATVVPALIRCARGSVVSVAVLDDDRDVAVSLALCLRRAGFDAHAFEAESALLESAADVRFDCLIADWSLGRSTARSVIEKMRSMDGYSELPVLVLSGSLCLDGTPASAELRSAIQDLTLIFRAKPRTTAELVIDLRALSDQGITA